jgi:hypothetical protein
MVKIHEGVGWPDFLPQLFPQNYRARVFQQNPEDLEWLLLQSDSGSIFFAPQFSRTLVQFEAPEAYERM